MREPLLATLIRHANHRGLILASEPTLLRERGGAPAELREELMALEEARQVEVLAPLPFLVLRLVSWSGSSRDPARNSPMKGSSPAVVHRKVPVSSSSAAAAAATHEDGGAGEGGRLLEEVLAALGPEAGRAEFAAILKGRPPALIRRCLQRVEATARIRVSKPALFRSLLAKLSR